MKVRTDDKQFIIECEVWENERVKTAPTRKWEPKLRKWLLPIVRPNCLWLVTECHASEIDPHAFDAANKVLSQKKKVATIPAWYKFKREPRPHQLEAINKFYSLNECAAFMEMRTGKTKVAIDLASIWAMEGKINAVIIVVDSAYKVVWPDEFAKDCPIEHHIHIVEAGKYDALSSFTTNTELPGLKVLVTATEGYSQGHLHKHVDMFAMAHKCMTIVDESESIKNHQSIRTKKITNVGGYSQKRMILTGTEITQGIEDLYGQFAYLNWAIIGMKNYYAFRARYCVMGGFQGKKIVSYRQVPQLLGLLEPYVYQCNMADVNDDMPEAIHEHCVVEPTPTQKRMFEELGDPYQMATYQGDRMLEPETVLERMTRYQQIAAGIFPYDISDEDKLDQVATYGKVKNKHGVEYITGKNPKIDQLIEVIHKVRDRKIIVWCRFVPEIAAVVQELEHRFGPESVCEYHGGNVDTRTDEYHRFQEDESARFFVTNKSGARALELAAASCHIFLTRSFSYSDNKQAEFRTNSSEQKAKSVLYYDIIMDTDVDKQVHEAYARKMSMADYVKEHWKQAKSRS